MNMQITILIIFVIGYAAIALEHTLKMNKAVPALLTAVGIWTCASVILPPELLESEIGHHISEIAQITFFLWGAMTIVELIAAHDGFELITNKIATKKKSILLLIVSIITFFLSALLDNMTTAIVMLSLIRKILQNPRDRWMFIGMIVIAANAGGAWSPIGDVTTTMLWIGKQITDLNIIKQLFLPSLVAMVVPMVIMMFRMKGNIEAKKKENNSESLVAVWEQKLVFLLGMGALIFVPVFKKLTHLPPFIGMLCSLAVLWLVTEIIHKKKNDEVKKATTIVGMLTRIDTPTLLFFVGILLAVSGLQTVGILGDWAVWADQHVPNKAMLLTGVGAISSIIDNIPVVKAVQSMYPLTQYVTDHPFWGFLAYSAGTGGSILIIGSAAGVAAMGIEKNLTFGWYLKNITPYALISFLSGVGFFLLFNTI